MPVTLSDPERDQRVRRMLDHFAVDPADTPTFEALEEHLFLAGAWSRLAGVYEARISVLGPREPQRADLLLRHLYQALVRYTELNVRHAVRLDHGNGDEEDADAPHWLMNRLASDGGRDPLAHLVETEEAATHPDIDAPHPSLAGAWVVLLRACGNRMPVVAARLLISVSHTRRCRAKAEMLARRQHAIPLAPPRTGAELGPWRRYRAIRAPRQLAFDFDGPLLARLP